MGGRVASLSAATRTVAPRTAMLATLARELVGRAPDPDGNARAARLSAERDAQPIDDVRSTAAYRRLVLQNVLRTELERLTLSP